MCSSPSFRGSAVMKEKRSRPLLPRVSRPPSLSRVTRGSFTTDPDIPFAYRSLPPSSLDPVRALSLHFSIRFNYPLSRDRASNHVRSFDIQRASAIRNETALLFPPILPRNFHCAAVHLRHRPPRPRPAAAMMMIAECDVRAHSWSYHTAR